MKELVRTRPQSSGNTWPADPLQARLRPPVLGAYVRHFIDEQRRDTCAAHRPAIARRQLA
ncbi:AAA family ATPase, partial [Pseudomonas aeruginosa]